MILLNDCFKERDQVNIDFEDRGYQFGDGIYEVIRVYNGVSFQMEPHLKRLQQSAQSIELTLPYPIEIIKKKLNELVLKNTLSDGIVYIQITRGVASRTHHYPDQSTAVLVAYTTQSKRPIKILNTGIHAIITDDIRWVRCDIKSLNLLGNSMAKQHAKKHGYDEAILHRDEIITEGSSSNVFIVKNNVLFTHPANNLILNGITRMEVLRMAKEIGYQVIQEAFSVKELIDADEVFVTSTTMEITPVIKINQSIVGTGKPGNITRKLQNSFEQLLT